MTSPPGSIILSTCPTTVTPWWWNGRPSLHQSTRGVSWTHQTPAARGTLRPLAVTVTDTPENDTCSVTWERKEGREGGSEREER